MNNTPKLDKLIQEGTVYIDGNQYIGKTSDGVEVILGITDNKKTVEKYLDNYPTPDTW